MNANFSSLNNFLLLLLIISYSRATKLCSKQERFHTILFDAYGTLLDISFLQDAVSSITSNPSSFVTLWRNKQINYSWLRSLMGKPYYKNFWKVTQDALDYTLKSQRIKLTISGRDKLMNAWLKLPAFPDAITAIQDLKFDYHLSVLSNGNPDMLNAVFRFNNLQNEVKPLISVDEARIYKPHPQAYALGQAKLHLSLRRILFVSSNAWDAVGAKAFGYTVAWINRDGAVLDNLGAVPDMEFSSLGLLSEHLKSL